MGGNSDEEYEVTVPVRLQELRDLEDSLRGLLSQIDVFVRLRPEVMRLLRVLGNMDPEKTPVHPTSHAPDAAYRTSLTPPPLPRIPSVSSFGRGYEPLQPAAPRIPYVPRRPPPLPPLPPKKQR